MPSILIAHSYFLRFDPKQFERAKPYPPLATLQAAALLRGAGHQVALFDAMLAEDTGEFAPRLAAAAPQVVLYYEDNFNYLSKMCLGRMRQAAREMIGMARARGCTIIVAGSDATDAPAPYLDAGADLVVLGEGLPTLLELMGRLDASPGAPVAALLDGLPGIAYHAGDGLRIVAGASLLPTPQQPALPAWDLVDMERYRTVWRAHHGYFSLNMAASRGCPFRCNWCAKPIWGNRYLQRPAAEVAAEMAHLRRHYEPDHVWFTDDIFGFRADWIVEFATAARAAGGSIPFTIQTRADLVSTRMAAVLREAGCVEAWLGAESGSQRILDAMNKGTTVAEIHTARAHLREHGIRAGFFIQLGYLGEALEDLLATRRLIEAACPDDIGVSVSYPLPGTKFHDTVKAQLGSKTRWNDSGDLAMMFQGTYRSDFYRAVRDCLHDHVSNEARRRQLAEDEYAQLRRALEQRWEALVRNEAAYRSVAELAAAVG